MIFDTFTDHAGEPIILSLSGAFREPFFDCCPDCLPEMYRRVRGVFIQVSDAKKCEMCGKEV